MKRVFIVVKKTSKVLWRKLAGKIENARPVIPSYWMRLIHFAAFETGGTSHRCQYFNYRLPRLSPWQP